MSGNLSDWATAEGSRIRQRVRMLMLLDASDYAVIGPLSTSRLHALAFLADVLSPVYNLSGTAGRIMKRRAGPYFPELQWELDRLVGLGLVEVSGLRPVVEVSRAYIDANFALMREAAQPILTLVYEDHGFLALKDFFREIAGALSRVPDNELDTATRADVTWQTGHAGTVIDYAEWRARNYSMLSAARLEELAKEALGQGGLTLTPTARVGLYVQYLKRVAHG